MSNHSLFSAYIVGQHSFASGNFVYSLLKHTFALTQVHIGSGLGGGRRQPWRKIFFRQIVTCSSSWSPPGPGGRATYAAIERNTTRPNTLLTAVFFKLVQCQPRLNRKIQPFVVEGVRFNHT